jgi:hypothetical protein
MKLTAIYSTVSPAQAQLIAGVLESHGVPAVVTEQQSTSILGQPAHVRVRDDHAEQARAIVEEFLNAGKSGGEVKPWTCPGCGEVLEPQFGGCWNCLTPRPESGDPAPPPPPRAAPDPEIVVDLACLQCRYNLKALAIDGHCPECGHPILPSLLELLRQVDVPSDEDQSPAAVLRPCLDWIEKRYGFTVESIAFVLEVWPKVLESKGDRDVASLAQAVRRVGTFYFSGPVSAERSMARWNLSPDKLARLIQWLIEQRMLSVP